MPWANVPQCEACWVEEHFRDVNGEVSCRKPTTLKEPFLEYCHFCRKPTIVGIIVRAEVTAEEKKYYDS